MKTKRIMTIALTLMITLMMICGCGNNDSEKTQSADAGDEIAVVDVIGKPLADAEAALKNAGFTNVTSNADSNADKSEWVVIDQSVKAGQNIHPEDSIELTCALKCKLFIDVTSESNLFLNKYDIIISLDGKELGTVSNGKEFTVLTDVLSGEHELVFSKAGDSSVSSTRSLTVTGNMTYACDLAHGGSSIDIKNEDIKNDIGDAELEMIDVTGMVLSEAIEKLSGIGFSNIREEPYGNVWDKDNWLVTAQNVAAGTVMSKADFIQLDCISLDDYFSKTYVGKNILEIQKLANVQGFSIRYENEELEDISEMVSDMDGETRSKWIVSEASQYVGEDKTAVVIVYNSNKATESAENAGTAHPAEDVEPSDEAAQNADEESQASNEGEQGTAIPIMIGTNIDTITEAAEECGLAPKYSDEDFGYGTKMRPLSSDNGGLSLDIIYSVETNEILCANIVTMNGYSTLEEQKEFVSSIAGVLCPAERQEEITEWVTSNVGDVAETTIDGIVYEIGVGPTGNIIYSAGNRNWEEWMISLD